MRKVKIFNICICDLIKKICYIRGGNSQKSFLLHSGNVLLQKEYKLFPMVEGYVVQKLVRDGEAVKEGQTPFVLDNDQQLIKEQTTGSIFSIASQNASDNSPALQELKANIENAGNKLTNDSLNFVRYQNLINNNAVAQIDYDRAALAYKNAKYAVCKSVKYAFISITKSV